MKAFHHASEPVEVLRCSRRCRLAEKMSGTFEKFLVGLLCLYDRVHIIHEIVPISATLNEYMIIQCNLYSIYFFLTRSKLCLQNIYYIHAYMIIH